MPSHTESGRPIRTSLDKLMESVSALNSIIGVWVLIVPIGFLGASTIIAGSYPIVSVLLFLFSGATYFHSSGRGIPGGMILGTNVDPTLFVGGNLLAGLWLLGLSLLRSPGTLLFWNDVITGVLVTCLSLYASYRASTTFGSPPRIQYLKRGIEHLQTAVPRCRLIRSNTRVRCVGD